MEICFMKVIALSTKYTVLWWSEWLNPKEILIHWKKWCDSNKFIMADFLGY